MPARRDLRSVCVIGSGPIVICQACEFDYAGCQALKVLREDGYRTIVVNSNPATIMTDPGFADRTYIEPLDLEGVADVLRRERPDGLLPTLGGQTALNLAIELETAGVLEDLVEAVGVDAARYALARSSVDSPLDIDLALLQKRSNDNPVFYVQYAHARTSGVGRNARELGVGLQRADGTDGFDPALLDHPTETALLADVKGSHKLSDGTDIYGRGYTDCVLAARSDLIAQNPAGLKALIKGMFKAQLMAETQPEEALKVLVGPYYKTSVENARLAMSKQPAVVDARGQTNFILERTDSLVEMGYIKRKPDRASIDWTLLEQVIAENPELYAKLKYKSA